MDSAAMECLRRVRVSKDIVIEEALAAVVLGQITPELREALEAHIREKRALEESVTP